MRLSTATPSLLCWWITLAKTKCTKCNYVGDSVEFVDIEVYCECCGDHPGKLCPNCDEALDYVYDEYEEL